MTTGDRLVQAVLAEIEERFRGPLSLAPLTDVAASVGYLDVTHFTRHVERAYGQTPGAWRRAHRQPADPTILPADLL